MEPTALIRGFQDFLEKHYIDQIAEKARKGEKYLKVDFNLISQFNPEIADELLENPEDVLKAGEIALEQFEVESDLKNFKIRIFNLPQSMEIMIKDIRSEHINKFLFMKGLVRQKSDVRPQVTTARFECPSCGNVITILQLDSKFKEPERCGCGRKGRFRLLSKELVDAQKIVLEEAPEDLDGGEQPKRLDIFLKSDLVSPISERKTNPGSKIIVYGILKEVPIPAKEGGKLTRFDLMIEANCVEPVDEDFLELKISSKEEQEILELANDPGIFDKLVSSLAPTIYGHEKIKEALVLQAFGGVRKKRQKGSPVRGDMHILLIGDPGSGKSQLLKRVSQVVPKARYVSGKGASAAGLTATVVKDDFIRGYALEAGALVLANRGLCCTTGDAEFITEDLRKIRFEQLFRNRPDIIYPEFKVLAYNEKTRRIEPFGIKRAFRIKNNKRICRIKTRTGREIKLTEDNEILTINDSRQIWIEVRKLKKYDFIAVPRVLRGSGKDLYNQEFAYVCGLIATDGHIKINNRHAMVSFYNSNPEIIDAFTSALKCINVSYNTYVQKKGRISEIYGQLVITKKNVYNIYNTRKSFATSLIEFGIPSGEKSRINQLNNKILCYSKSTLASFMRGVFDGDGSIRKNPFEITITTGIYENARLFQEIFLRLGIISSVKKSTRSWHCDIRGAAECMAFFNIIGSKHSEKVERLEQITNISEVKDRLDILPNCQEFFKMLIERYRWKLGKKVYKYIWQYSKENVCPSIDKLKQLNSLIQDKELDEKINTDILWDKITSIEQVHEEYVYDFTMEKTNNFIANSIIMHNCIDELDKMSKEDRSAMHEGLEQQTVTISKANIQATLRAETTVLAAANPKFGRFDPYEILAKQIDLPSTLINRFDLIFPVKDMPDQKKDEKMAGFILGLHKDETSIKTELEADIMKKYFAYARQNAKPILSDEAIEEIKKYYVSMRSSGSSEEGAMRAIPITARQLEALVRLAEASAKVRLSDKVSREDAKRAIELVHYCLTQIGMDPETGKFDIDRIASGVTASERSSMVTVREIIKELESKVGKTIPVEDILIEASSKGLSEDKVIEMIEKLKRSGDIFEPKRGFVSKM